MNEMAKKSSDETIKKSSDGSRIDFWGTVKNNNMTAKVYIRAELSPCVKSIAVYHFSVNLYINGEYKDRKEVGPEKINLGRECSELPENVIQQIYDTVLSNYC